jgi:DNA-binding transcriptional regulator LsrR (DeoR family)
MLVEEGLTKAEVGRAFGISRSLVSRMLNELRA